MSSHSGAKITTTKTSFLEQAIRDGFTSDDVRMWQALCRHCEVNVGNSIHYMFTILDMAKHNKCDPLEIISMGRKCSEQKNVNDKFMESLLLAVQSDEEGEGPFDDDAVAEKKIPKIIDLTCDEELSGSYEETSDPPRYPDASQMYNDMPNSNEAYEIDGFVVEDSEGADDDVDDKKAPPKTPKANKLKRRLTEDADF